MYRDSEGTVAGVTKVVIKQRSSTPGALRVLLLARGGGYTMPTPPFVKTTIVIDAPIATTGQCGEVTFVTSGPSGTPVCKVVNRGNGLVCH
jgi:hypothetical protein